MTPPASPAKTAHIRPETQSCRVVGMRRIVQEPSCKRRFVRSTRRWVGLMRSFVLLSKFLQPVAGWVLRSVDRAEGCWNLPVRRLASQSRRQNPPPSRGGERRLHSQPDALSSSFGVKMEKVKILRGTRVQKRGEAGFERHESAKGRSRWL